MPFRLKAEATRTPTRAEATRTPTKAEATRSPPEGGSHKESGARGLACADAGPRALRPAQHGKAPRVPRQDRDGREVENTEGTRDDGPSGEQHL